MPVIFKVLPPDTEVIEAQVLSFIEPKNLAAMRMPLNTR